MDPTPENDSEKPQTSYLQAISSWGNSRSTTPKPVQSMPGEGSGLKNQHGGDHTQHWYGLSLKKYPPDCPPVNPRWYYAVDVPKRKPKLLNKNQEETKHPVPKKHVPFSVNDSDSIEAAYQKLADEYNDFPSQEIQRKNQNDGGASPFAVDRKPNTSINDDERGKVQVPVQEDFLFDVDIEKRELAPAYWLGPIYEVRRGLWFYMEGSTLRPCEERLSAQLEEGFLKIKPWKYPQAPEKSSSKSVKPGDDTKRLSTSGALPKDRSELIDVTPKASMENLRAASKQSLEDNSTSSSDIASSPHQPQSYRLFGDWMNSTVTYQDSTVAWLSADSIMSRVSSTVYQKFAGGVYLGGVKLVRGYEAGKSKAPPAEKAPTTPVTASTKVSNAPSTLQLDEKQAKLLKRRSAPPSTSRSEPESIINESIKASVPSLGGMADEETEAEAIRKRDEKEIENDYKDVVGDSQGRRITHLLLVTHGIGQKLGLKTEQVNFIGDVNAFRHCLKNVYESSADLQALNSEIDKLPKNCRIQVLPICWRHLLDFPKRAVRQTRDLGDAFGDEDEYPSLEDITVEGVAFARSLITDLALDILLYQSAYREHICNIVLAESNRIYHLFCERNPEFKDKGSVSLVGHSLGSAILFDILSRQKENKHPHAKNSHAKHRRTRAAQSTTKDMDFDFEVEDFYCLGSPIGLFQMLKGRTILARHSREDAIPAESPMDPEYMTDPFLAAGSSQRFPSGEHISSVTGLPLTISSPKVEQLYNIFHPSDPIAYRLEPLISPAMSSMKPQVLPYTKRTISASVSGIGTKINQSVSGMWSSLSAGLATSLLNRSLGLSTEDVARMETPTPQKGLQSAGAGTNISAGGVLPTLERQNTMEKQTKLAEETAAADRKGTGSSPATLIDDEIETLFSGFQKRQEGHQDDSDEIWSETEEKANKLRREEAKIRALNRNGRVDYSIQESVLDFNPINTIASHLSYWSDEDVAHFMMSQLLSRNRKSA